MHTDNNVNRVLRTEPGGAKRLRRTPEEARMPLLTTQSALRVKLERVVLCHYAEARPEWRKYLFLDSHEHENVGIRA